MKNLSVLDWIATIILFIGGINWGLVGLFKFNLVQAIFGSLGALDRVIYVIVGLCAIWVLVRCIAGCGCKK